MLTEKDARTFKIAYIATSFLPSQAANSVHVMKMCSAFAANGQQVVLIGRRSKVTDRLVKIDDIYDHYGTRDDFCIRRIQAKRLPGISYYYAFRAAQLARAMKVDVVYTRHVLSAYFSTLLKIPTTFEAHASVAQSGRDKQWVFSRLSRSNYFKGLTVISESLRRHYAEAYPHLIGRTLVVPDGADPLGPHTRPRRLLPDADGRICVGYVGHLYEGKGVEIVAQAAQTLPDMHFAVVGGTDQDILGWRQRTEHLPNIHFYGHVAPRHVPEFLLSCDILVAPYQTSVSAAGNQLDVAQWMSPLKIFEYMAVGKPIVCSDLPVLREILAHDYNALLCPPQDVGAWVNALRELAGNEGLRQRIARTAQKQFQTRFTWSARARNVLGFIERSDVRYLSTLL